jgi:hypothetical protein
MTYNQLITTITDLLQSHAMISQVRNATPQEWMFKDNQPVYPIACFSILNASANKGLEQVYSVQFFFLDKSGAEQEFEPDVTSDQFQIAADIISLMRGTKRTYTIDDQVTRNAISDKYEDYLAGCEFTLNITTQGAFDGCDAPII